jgi:tetraacyldisaccharide 4'-kinase
MALAEKLEAAWYGDGPLPWWAPPLAWLYGRAIRWRASRYRRGKLPSERLPVPVIVIGNLTAGGTGKTPLTMAVVELLRRHGYRPGVVSRGYGGRQREPMLLGRAPDPAQVGDEPCLIAASGVPVAVGRDRPAAARLLLGDVDCNVIVADDGLQHYRLARDVEICVIDGMRRFGNGRLLPAGPLREPMPRLQRVDLRVCHGGVPAAGEYPMQLHGGEAVKMRGGERQPLSRFAGQRVHGVAAIGHPQRFFDSLRDAGIEVAGHAFPDHHAFEARDLAFTDDAPVLMTDKDAVKCQRFAMPHWWRVPVGALLPPAFDQALLERLDASVKR